MPSMTSDPIVKVVLDHGRGDVLIEGENLTQTDAYNAFVARFPDAAVRRRQESGVVFTLASGQKVRFWRFGNEEPRVVDGKIIL